MKFLQEPNLSQKAVNRIAAAALFLSITSVAVLAVMLITGGTEKRIGVVRSNNLIQGYKAMQDAQERYENKQKVWQTSISTLEEELQSAVENYRAVYASLSKAEIQKQELALEQKRSNYVQYTRSIKEKVEAEENGMMQGVLNQINSFVEQYGKEHGFDVILGTTAAGNVLYGTESVDITDEVLKALNDAYTSGNNGARNVSQ